MRPLGVTDRAFVRELSRRVFSHFGDYEHVLPEWLDGPGVWGHVATESDAPVGFIMLSLSRMPGGPVTDLAVDVMAIAVQPESQRTGVGRRLMERALQEAERLASGHLRVLAVSLLVGEENQPARRLFEQLGFQALPGRESYPRGQPALRMVRPVVSCGP